MSQRIIFQRSGALTEAKATIVPPADLAYAVEVYVDMFGGQLLSTGAQLQFLVRGEPQITFQLDHLAVRRLEDVLGNARMHMESIKP